MISPNKTYAPNTAMTAEAWLRDYKPTPGTLVAVSTQPHAHYQHKTLQNVLPSNFPLDIMAPACSDKTALNVKLDAVWLWVKHQK